MTPESEHRPTPNGGCVYYPSVAPLPCFIPSWRVRTVMQAVAKHERPTLLLWSLSLPFLAMSKAIGAGK